MTAPLHCGREMLSYNDGAGWWCPTCRVTVHADVGRDVPATPAPRPTAAADKLERDIQRKFFDWLRTQGIYERTSDNILRQPASLVGWCVHLNKPRGNPYLCDCLILVNGHALEIELKAATTRVSDEQAALVANGHAILCRGLQAAIESTAQWLASVRGKQ